MLALCSMCAHSWERGGGDRTGGEMAQQDHGARLSTVLREWAGIEVSPHRFGGVEFRVDRREVGHVHPNGTLDLPFPVRLRRELVAAGRADAHHMLPNTGWVTFRIRTEHDVPAAIDLLRMNYERLRGVQARATVPLFGNVTMLGEGDIGDLPA
jgi:hypothetical protein